MELAISPGNSLAQGRVVARVSVRGARDVDEQLHHVLPISNVDVLRADLLPGAVHVVVIAQRNTDRAGGVAECVVNRRLARSARHKGALELKRLVAFRELLGGLREEERER